MTESKRIKNDLSEYERFFSLNEDMMVILSEEGKILKLNSKIIKVLGYSKEYLMDVPFEKIFHLNDVKIASKAFGDVHDGNVMINFKARVVCQNGSIRWFMFSALKIEETGSLYTVAKDITEMEKSQRAIDLLNNELKEREHKYRQLFEKSSDSSLLVKDGLFVDCNQAAIEMFECGTKEYFIGSDPSKVSTEYQPNGEKSFFEAKKMMEIAIDNGTHRYEWLYKKKNGIVFPTEVVLTLVSKGLVHVVLRDISERVLKDKELKESQKLLIDSQHLANMGSWKWDLSTNDVAWSDELYIIFGLDKDKFEPSHLGDLELIHIDDQENVRQIISNAVKEKTMFQYEDRIVRPSGEIRHIKSWGNVILDGNGSVVSLYGACLDITNEKLQKENHTKVLKEQLRRNKRLISTTLDGYVLTKENGNIVEVNRSYSEFIGYSEKELLKLNLNSLEVTMSPMVLYERNVEIKNTERAKYETKYICKNGELKNVEVSLALVKIKGESTMIAKFIRDITDRKINELRKTVYNNISQKLNTKISVFEFCKFIEIELKKIMSITSFYIMLFDKNNLSSIFINDKFIKSHENVNRKDGQGLCEFVIHNKKSLRLNKGQYEKIIKKEGIKQYRTSKPYWMGAPMISEDNSIGIITVDTYFENQVYTDEDLVLLEFIGIQLGRLISRKENSYKLRLLNVTLEERVELRTFELSKAKDKLAESLKKEKELSTLKSRFVSTASHQFRTPLTVIQTNIGILEIQKNKMGDDYEEIFDKIALRIGNQINKMTSMMDELLTIGKINENGINYNPKLIEIDKLCQKIILSYNDIQTDKRVLNLKINGNIEDVFLDPILMEHVLSALISNAFKYSLNRPNPILTLTFSEKELSISIKDFGIGIPEQDIEHIHEPFFRASNAINISGTGLGTSIVKEYVEINKGELKIISKLNIQTEFILVFKR